MSNGSRFLILGLKGSGKTSYLAALWHLIEAGELPASLTAPTLQPNREYLNRIRDTWLKFQEIGRTSLRLQETLSLVLRDAETGLDVNVTLPDMSGESLRLQWALRKATVRYAEFAKESSGLLLFIHSDSVKKTSLISPLVDSIEKPPDNVSVGQSQKEKEQTQVAEHGKPWSPELSPTQVQLVELLQFAYWLHSPALRFRVTIIISAWDRVRQRVSPRSWLESRLPLLSQFLMGNEETIPFRIFGVSALGGDLKEDLEELKKQKTPSARIQIVNEALNEDHDLTAPLRFLLGLDNAGQPSGRG